MQLPLEQLGTFYLGGLIAEDRKVSSQPALYDARDLTTHAICVGMTGSGKTGLCIGLLEEAALDRVPALLIDPKGDITNLLLQFPDLLPEDFQPWINVDDARRKNQSVEEFAADTAEKWRNGLADWGIDGELIRKLNSSTDYTIFTPGSDAGVGVNIMGSMVAPAIDFDDDAEMLRERISGLVAALLALVGEDVDPVRSNEAVLLAMIFEHYWRRNEDIDLPGLILAIQSPPFEKLGVFDVETVYPSKERTELAMAFNTMMASPTFAEWLQGEPLEIESLLYTDTGLPRHSVFYLAHLTESERMFFVTLLLDSVITWMRSQSGTTSLRAIVYFDEVFGFFPPTAEPPSKRPLLTIMKQARAFGVGAVLVTQNPVDIDYKGLSNAGTWFIGKLQTERDKARVLDGLEGAIADAGQNVADVDFDSLISGLNSRMFLMHNIHADAPTTFHTRWVMSYLRGPLTRPQVRTLMESAGKRTDRSGTTASTSASEIDSPEPAPAVPVHAENAPVTAQTVDDGASSEVKNRVDVPEGYVTSSVGLDTEILQTYIPATISRRIAESLLFQRQNQSANVKRASLVYLPGITGEAEVQFIHRRRNNPIRRVIGLWLPLADTGASVRWEDAFSVNVSTLQRRPDVAEAGEGPFYAPVPTEFDSEREFKSIANDFSDWLYYNQRVPMLAHEALDLYQEADETDKSFHVRVTQAAREARDAEVDDLEDTFESKIERIEDKIRATDRKIEGLELELSSRRQMELINLGESALGYFLNKRRSSLFSGIGSKRRMTTKANHALETATEQREDLQEDIAELETELEEASNEITMRWADALERIETIELKPRRADVEVIQVALGWAPHWLIEYEDSLGRMRSALMPAYEVEQAIEKR